MVSRATLKARGTATRARKAAQRKRSTAIIQSRRANSRPINRSATTRKVTTHRKSNNRSSGSRTTSSHVIAKESPQRNNKAKAIKNNRDVTTRASQLSKTRNIPKQSSNRLISANQFAIRKFNQLNKDRNIPTGSSFTVAVPVSRDKDKVVIQDHIFRFKKDKLIESKKLKGSRSIHKDEFQQRTGVDIFR